MAFIEHTLLIVLSVVITQTFVQGQVIHTLGDGSTSWESASSACTLATPKINFTNGEMVPVLKGGAVNLTEGEEAWLGYVLDSVILQNIGCMAYNVNEEPRLSTYIDTGADPGLCYSACREMGYFGIMKTKCFCFNTMPSLSPDDMFETTCRQTCSKLNDEAICGGNNVVSLYKIADELAVSDVEDFPVSRNSGNCVLYDKNVEKLYGTKCTMSYRIGCQRMSGDLADINSRTVTWLEMTGYCSSNKLYPYTHEGALKDSGDYFQVWTGMVKARKLYKKDEVMGQPLGIAYIRVENGQHKMRFSSPLSTVERKFICQEGVETTTVNKEVTGPVTEPSRPDVDVKASRDVQEANLLPLFIILPIVLILVAIVIVLLVIRWRRRKRNKKLKSRSFKKNHNGKVGKRKGSSYTDGSYLSNETDQMNYKTPDADLNAGKRPSISNNLIATISLDNAYIDNEAFVGDMDDINRHETTFTKEPKKQPRDKNKGDTNKHPANMDKANVRTATQGKDYAQDDNEYARINKKRKESSRETGGGDQRYDKLGGTRGGKDASADKNYDMTTFGKREPGMYDSTSKPMAVPQRDYLYDGLHKF